MSEGKGEDAIVRDIQWSSALVKGAIQRWTSDGTFQALGKLPIYQHMALFMEMGYPPLIDIHRAIGEWALGYLQLG